MPAAIIAFIISIIPSILIIIRLRARRPNDPVYVDNCNYALRKGLLSVLPIMGVSALFAISTNILGATVLQDVHVLVKRAIHTFLVLAFAEELVKFMSLKSVLKESKGAYTWADVVAFMVIIGTAFGLVEDIPFAIGASPGVMIVRGITMGHVGYGYLMGRLYGKMLYTGDTKYGVLAFLIPFLIHGLYDFSLSSELLELNDDFAIIAVSLAVVGIVLLIRMIMFFVRTSKQPQYNEPLPWSGM